MIDILITLAVAVGVLFLILRPRKAPETRQGLSIPAHATATDATAIQKTVSDAAVKATAESDRRADCAADAEACHAQ
jgi:hypothetical protein